MGMVSKEALRELLSHYLFEPVTEQFLETLRQESCAQRVWFTEGPEGQFFNFEDEAGEVVKLSLCGEPELITRSHAKEKLVLEQRFTVVRIGVSRKGLVIVQREEFGLAPDMVGLAAVKQRARLRPPVDHLDGEILEMLCCKVYRVGRHAQQYWSWERGEKNGKW